MNSREPATILVVDDIADNIDRLVHILAAQYRVTFATNGADALRAAAAEPRPSLILLDIVMPGMDGYEVCRRLKAEQHTAAIPVIFLSALSDMADEALGFELGAADFLQKPCHPAIVAQRVRIHLERHNQTLALETLVRERTSELEQSRRDIVRRLGRAGEYRDNETGMHVIRMSLCCQQLALAAGIAPAQAELLQLAAPMHDIGKIGIPDHILLKRGKLDEQEWQVMRRHPQIGAEIIGEHRSDLLSMAATVALTHHERWDGMGYPHGLAGAAIPIVGRIAAICDVYDALRSERPYKQAWPVADALALLEREAGRAFDPALVQLFVDQLVQMEAIRSRYADPGASELNSSAA